MAKGLAVLQAVLDGKRVRFRWTARTAHPWVRWCPSCQAFERDGEGHSPPYPVLVHELWREEWDIDEPTMTFTEAVAAMDAGQMVECPEIGMQFRRDGDDYVSRPIGGGDWTRGAVFYFGDIHARDWRVVTEEPTDARPTLRDARTYLTGMVQAELDATVNNANFVAQWTLQVLLERWPAMFRKEDA